MDNLLSIDEIELLCSIQGNVPSCDTYRQLADTMRKNAENCRLLGISRSHELSLITENERLREALNFIRKCAQVATPVSVCIAITDAIDEILLDKESK